MKNYILKFFILFFCNYSFANSFSFGDLRIPKENINSPFSADNGNVYDSSEGSESIIVKKSELIEYGLKYNLPDEEEFVSFMMYEKPFDIKEMNDDLMQNVKANHTEKDNFTRETKLITGDGRWLLQDNEKNVIAICHLGEIMPDMVIIEIATCTFMKNIRGYGVQYSLDDSNIGKYKQFEKYLSNKIDSWKVVNKN